MHLLTYFYVRTVLMMIDTFRWSPKQLIATLLMVETWLVAMENVQSSIRTNEWMNDRIDLTRLTHSPLTALTRLTHCTHSLTLITPSSHSHSPRIIQSHSRLTRLTRRPLSCSQNSEVSGGKRTLFHAPVYYYYCTCKSSLDYFYEYEYACNCNFTLYVVIP